MSNAKPPDDFAERLRRIAQQRQQQGTTAAPKPRPQTGAAPAATGQRMRNALIWLLLGLGVGTGGYVAWKSIPPDTAASFASLTAAIAGLASGGALPAQTLGGDTPWQPGGADTTGARGANPVSPAVASTLPDPVQLGDLVTAAAPSDASTQIGRIIPFDRNSQCNLRRPRAGEQVVNVRLENGTQTTAVRAIAAADLVQQVLGNVQDVTRRGRPYAWTDQVTGDLTAVDVILTDTSAPIYLVLQNRGTGIIWNIQPAPGVTLAHVAIVSSAISGLVSPPATTTFEALLDTDFVTPHEFGADDVIRACMVRPWRQPQPDWQVVQNAGSNVMLQNQIDSFTKGYAAYNAWYTGALGVDAGTNLISPQTAAHVHVGPKPDAPFAYRGLAGQDIYMMRTDHLFSGDPASLQVQIDRLHGALLRDAIGGDLALLDPAPVARDRP